MIINGKEFIPIKGYEERYFISKDGDVYSSVTNRFRKKVKLKTGYIGLILNNKGIEKNFLLHRLIAESFLPNPDKKPHINHKNLIRHDYRLENLEWCTQKENWKHAIDNGVVHPCYGEKHYNSKITLDTAINIFKQKGTGLTLEEVAKKFNVGKWCVHSIFYKGRWSKAIKEYLEGSK